MSWPPILVRYGELGIKSRPVRSQFEKKLVERIEEQLVARGVEAEVVRQQGRVLVRASDTERAVDALRHTFGVVSVSPAVSCEPTPAGVAARALEVARERLREGQSFALKVRRAGQHAFTSLDVAKAAAERILTELADRKPRVDLDAPDLLMHAEVRDAEAFFFLRVERGPGGLPLGSQGRVGILVDQPRAAHAAWLLGKRGTTLYLYAPDPARAEAWLAPLRAWVPGLRVRPLAGATRAEQLESVKPQMAQHRLEAIVVADGIEGALAGRAEDVALGAPVFRPLVGYSGERFRQLCRDAELPEV